MTPAELAGYRIGYAPYSDSMASPGDRRRFVNWARSRGVAFEVAQPAERYDLVVLASTSDVSLWSRHPRDGTRIVYDLVDSYLTIPAWRPDDVARGLGKSMVRQHRRLTPSYTRAVIAMCRRADVVLCSTPEQRADILRYCDDVRVVLDVHDDELRPLPRSRGDAGRLRLFWEGLPQNLKGFRPALLPALEDVVRQVPLELHLATDRAWPRWLGRFGTARTEQLVADFPVPTIVHPWDLTTLPAVAAQCDVGIIPLDLHNRFAVGKPENKLLIMWQLGLPVVTSSTPAYDRTFTAAGAGLACRTRTDWVRALLALLDPAERTRLARAGEAYVRAHHTGEGIRRQWDAVAADLLGQAAP